MPLETSKLHEAASKLREAFSLVGLSCRSDDMKDTPIRVAKWLADLAQNQGHVPVLTKESVYDPLAQIKLTTFEDRPIDELVIETNITYSSFCAHHLLPFEGTATIGYLPASKIIGASKIPRILDFFANQPQTQEYLTQQVAEYIQHVTEARFVGAILTGTHSCCSCRGARKLGMRMVTSCFRPSDNASLKQEFLQLSKL